MAKKEKLHSNDSPAGEGREEETEEKGQPVMLLRFNKQPIKHLTSAGEQKVEWWGRKKKRRGIKRIEKGGQNEVWGRWVREGKSNVWWQQKAEW